MKNVGLGLAFLLEIVTFISFACLGFLLPLNHVLQIVSSAILFALLITFWSLYMAPKAPKKFKAKAYYLAKAIIYGLSTVVILETRGNLLGFLFVVLALADEAALFKHNLS